MKTLATLTLSLLCFAASAITTWKVGATQTYTTMSSIVGLVQDGDTIKIDGGVYLNDPVKWVKKNLTFIGLGTGLNRTIMRWNGGDIANGKGIWVFELAGTSDNATIENIVFDGAHVSDANGGNGAGIRYQARNITINNCEFMNCQNGILEGNGSITDSNVLIENSEFYNNGYDVTGNPTYSGYEHHMYISASADTFILKNCYIHDPRGEGNSVKTRAQRSYILNNYIDENQGQGSWEIDIAQGGLSIVMGNVIIQGPNSINHGIVGYDAVINAIEDFYFINNTVINKFAGSVRYFNVVPATGINKYKVYNNVFTTVLGASQTFMTGTVGAALDTSHNVIATNYLNVGFVNTATGDYHLTTGATGLINKGTAGGNASSGYSLTPMNEYVAFTSALASRTSVGVIDIGAYEFGNPAYVPFLNKSETGMYVYTDFYDSSINVVFTNANCDKDVYLYDISGKLVAKQEKASSSKITFAKGALGTGIYVVQAKVGDSVMCKKFIVQ